ncbi:type I polyketide synthase, partial [Flavobacterium sp. H122]|uniref:type I polyketide synthase n=1 Tax=Flavobacterium sp. H122 TaxID=2529860 RepID=UPI0010AAB668
TLGELVEYFIEEHYRKLDELIGISSREPINKNDTRNHYSLPTVSKQKNRLEEIQVHNHNKLKDVENIAIIGLSGRYPGAKNINEFWENLKQGKDSITEIPKDRWDIENFYDKEKGKEGKSYSKWGGFIEDVDKFDPLFFNISPREAQMMSPQERLFLQSVWETLEDAGYNRLELQNNSNIIDKSELGGKVGVFVGVMSEEYQLFGIEEIHKGNYVTPGGSPASIANRVSYFFNFHGPNMVVDTMCSSSLTAIHLACESIQNGNCELAIAGGVNVSTHPYKYLMLSNGRFVSGKGKCESFGEGGEGYVPSEGVGAVLLKPLSKAEADGDRIYGVIKGTAINHGGKTNGYTVPNPNAQSAVIKTAIKKAGVKAEDYSYIEAHGTGTSLGDPIEIAGLSKVFKSSENQYCSIGSVKSNIGHCESAAGMSGLTKLLLQLKYQQLVPSLHSEKLNPNIDFRNSPFKVQQELEVWTTKENKLRLAGINSFGAGGSNAHIVIEEYRSTKTRSYFNNKEAVIFLSAKNKDRLDNQVLNLKHYLESNLSENIHDIAYTLQIGREPMDERLALVVSDVDELLQKLVAYQDGKSTDMFRGNIKEDKEDVLLEGDTGNGCHQTAIKNNDSKSLAQLWVKGVLLDYSLFYPDNKPNKISLPTYPFNTKRY